MTLLRVAVVALLGISAAALTGAWSLPPTFPSSSSPACATDSQPQACVVIAEGDHRALLSAIRDDGVTEIWLAGPITIPPQAESIPVRRDLLIGGLAPFTKLAFETEGGVPGMLRVHGFLVLCRLQLYGFFEFVGPVPKSLKTDSYTIFGSVEILPMRLEDRLPQMAPFPQQWIPSPDGGVCNSGIALYEVDGQVSMGPLFSLLAEEEELAEVMMSEIFSQILVLLNSPMGVSTELLELLTFKQVSMLKYLFAVNEFIASSGWPCTYMVNVSQSLVGHEHKRQPSARDLHMGLSELQAECQTEGYMENGFQGKDYGGNISVAWSGRPCVPWKHATMFDISFDYMEGNSCRNPTNERAVWCFTENPDYYADADNFLAMRSLPRYNVEFCNVPLCGLEGKSECQYSEDRGRSYFGTQNRTESGEPCLFWTDISRQFSFLGPKNNYCRNPLPDEDGVWCYVNSDKPRMEKCSVPMCEDKPRTKPSVIVAEDINEFANVPVNITTPAPSDSNGIQEEQMSDSQSFSIVAIIALSVTGAIAVLGLGAWNLSRSRWHQGRLERLPSSFNSGVEMAPSLKHGIDSAPNSTAGSEGKTESSVIRNKIQAASSTTPVEILRGKNPMQLGLIKTQKSVGSGATSRVYEAQWLGVSAAVKVIQLYDLPPSFRTMVVQGVEGTLVKTLSHPHVVQTFHVYCVLADQPTENAGDELVLIDVENTSDISSAKELWLVQEFCELGDLTKPSVTPGNTDESSFQDMINMLIQIATALRYLHGLNIVHGDLKRANVLRKNASGQPVCKVTDLGMAHIMQVGQEYYFSDRLAGDFAYLAPEAAMEHKVSMKMDTYSLGILMYELYTGIKYMPNISLANHIRSLLVGDRPQFQGNVPHAFQELCQQCWSHLPADRPTDESIINSLKQMGGCMENYSDLPLANDFILEENSNANGYFVPGHPGAAPW